MTEVSEMRSPGSTLLPAMVKCATPWKAALCSSLYGDRKIRKYTKKYTKNIFREDRYWVDQWTESGA